MLTYNMYSLQIKGTQQPIPPITTINPKIEKIPQEYDLVSDTISHFEKQIKAAYGAGNNRWQIVS